MLMSDRAPASPPLAVAAVREADPVAVEDGPLRAYYYMIAMCI